jgi:uncharacterized protein involved in response to NO
MTERMSSPSPSGITVLTLWEEPFRLFFPLAVLAGLIGTLAWPLHFSGLTAWYPGVDHGRLMAQGFFGAFIVGFLGTSLPRLLSVRRLTGLEVCVLAGLHLCLIAAHAAAFTTLGDGLFLIQLGILVGSFGVRFFLRRDVPPPGFVLVGLALLCGAAGTVLALFQEQIEDHYFWIRLRPLLQYQGFILLPILGVGGFILPRFFGLESRQVFPESKVPPGGWTPQVMIALAAGIAVLASFVIEAGGWPRTGAATRFVVAAGYLYWQVPFFRSKVRGSSLALGLRIAFLLLPSGFLAVTLFPGYRVALMHLTLIGGFGLLTLCVATRVLMGHTGQGSALAGRHRWLTVVILLMLVGMLTRISGDYWPRILASHYSYGGFLWAAGLLLWAIRMLPSVRRPDTD